MHAATHPSHAAHLLALAITLAIASPAAANSNAVTQWNATTGSPVVASRFGAPPQQARAIAIVQIAVHDALNAIEPRYRSYNVIARAPAANPDAAVAAASHRALHRLIDPMPASQARTDALASIDAAYANALAAIPEGAAKAAGLVVGAAAADAIVDRRSNDGSATPNLPYIQPVIAGMYQPTPVMNSNPQAYVSPAFAGWGAMQPFMLRSPAQFRMPPGGLFDVKGTSYARQYNEVKQVGDALVRGAQPDSEESDIARFWPGGGANWNRTIREILTAPSLNPHLDLDLDLWQQARLFALANMAEADAAIAVFDTKYAYNFWRPITAIRWHDDGNPATAPNPAWWSFMATPPYPDFTCGLTTTAGANLEVLRRYFGTDDIAYGFSVNATAVPLPAPLLPLPAKPITRAFVSLSDAGSEAVDARVYGGMHFREGCRKGITQGAQVGRFVFQHALRPLKDHRR
ncbi:MAG TPA: vanadium-dependent haloperoxidase [Thermomonas sp.]|nr:vanadium-dependent haloperoxidase [Thermomonas sp.]